MGEVDTRTGGRPKPSLALGVPCVRPRVGVRLCRAGVAPSAPVGDRLPLPRFAHALRRRQALCVFDHVWHARIALAGPLMTTRPNKWLISG